jgi:hypothetical protein
VFGFLKKRFNGGLDKFQAVQVCSNDVQKNLLREGYFRAADSMPEELYLFAIRESRLVQTLNRRVVTENASWFAFFVTLTRFRGNIVTCSEEGS